MDEIECIFTQTMKQSAEDLERLLLRAFPTVLVLLLYVPHGLAISEGDPLKCDLMCFGPGDALECVLGSAEMYGFRKHPL